MLGVAQKARLLVGWTIFALLMGMTLALGANRPVSWTFLALAVMALFLVSLVLDAIEKQPRAFNRIWLPAILYLGFLLWGVIQILPGMLPAAWTHPVWGFAPDQPGRISADPAQGVHILMRLASYAMVFWIALRCGRDKETVLRYFKGFALFSAALAAFGIYAYGKGENPIVGELATNVVSASFAGRNAYATFAGFGLIVNLALLLRAASWAQEGRKSILAGGIEAITSGGWIWVAGITLCAGALLLSQSRGGAGAAIIGVLILLSTQRVRGEKASLGPALIVGAILLLIFVAGSTGTIDRLLTDSEENGRFAVYPAVVAAISERPLLGNGLGAFHTVFRAWVPLESAWGEWDMAHNSYLENIFELGLPAALALYAALGLIGLRLFQGVRTRRRNRAPVAIAFACFMLAGFHALFDFSLQMPAIAAFFAWILGLGYAQSFPATDLKEPRTKQG